MALILGTANGFEQGGCGYIANPTACLRFCAGLSDYLQVLFRHLKKNDDVEVGAVLGGGLGIGQALQQGGDGSRQVESTEKPRSFFEVYLPRDFLNLCREGLFYGLYFCKQYRVRVPTEDRKPVVRFGYRSCQCCNSRPCEGDSTADRRQGECPPVIQSALPVLIALFLDSLERLVRCVCVCGERIGFARDPYNGAADKQRPCRGYPRCNVAPNDCLRTKLHIVPLCRCDGTAAGIFA